MVISASYRTDIPAFYGDWFLNRLREGHCLVQNPYSGQASRVDLTPEAVSGFVFWTRNLGRFWPALKEVARRGQPFVVQMSVTDYPRWLERATPTAAQGVAQLKELRQTHGPRAGVWRYDPVLFTPSLDEAWHLRRFTALCGQLEGVVDEVVVSFAQFYQKTVRQLNQAGGEAAAWVDPPPEAKQSFLQRLAQVAGQHGLTLSLCAQRSLLVPGVADAACVDHHRLGLAAEGLFGSAPVHPPGHRAKACGCWPSRDIGAYDTCPHGCLYCYAVRSQPLAQKNLKRHDPRSPFLLAPKQDGRG